MLGSSWATLFDGFRVVPKQVSRPRTIIWFEFLHPGAANLGVELLLAHGATAAIGFISETMTKQWIQLGAFDAPAAAIAGLGALKWAILGSNQ